MPKGGRDGHFSVILLWVLLYTTRPSFQLGTGPLTKQKSELGWVGTHLWDQWFSGSSRHIHWRNPPHCIPLPSSTPDPHPFSHPRPLSKVERKHLMCLQQGGWDRPSVQLRPKEASWLLTSGLGWTWGWRGRFCHSEDATEGSGPDSCCLFRMSWTDCFFSLSEGLYSPLSGQVETSRTTGFSWKDGKWIRFGCLDWQLWKCNSLQTCIWHFQESEGQR